MPTNLKVSDIAAYGLIMPLAQLVDPWKRMEVAQDTEVNFKTCQNYLSQK